jgi:hypothetical protein
MKDDGNFYKKMLNVREYAPYANDALSHPSAKEEEEVGRDEEMRRRQRWG